MAWFKDFEFVRQAEPLAPRTWLRTGGPAEFFAAPRTVDELSSLLRRCQQEQLPVRILGGGSNILVRDEGASGVVIELTAPPFSEIHVRGRSIAAGAGAKLGHAISTSVREGLAGLESLVGIPGTVGGAIHGNAGGHAGDIGQWTARAIVMTQSGEVVDHQREDLIFAYRQSNLDEPVILRAEFQLEQEDREELTKRMQKLWIVKKASQPLSDQSAGCIFKNPRGMSAGMLIDQTGLKGARIGGAEVSDRHANFIITSSGAKSQDVLQLIEMVRNRVAERMGVELELEIDIW